MVLKAIVIVIFVLSIMKAAKAKKIIAESIWNEMYKEGCVIAITYYA